MSDIKCPICNKPMKQATYDYDKKDNDDTLYMSIMPCDCLCNFAASKAVWQELITTRKALDVAVGVLKGLKPEKAKGGGYWTYRTADVIKVINKALKDIEQIKDNDKDVI